MNIAVAILGPTAVGKTAVAEALAASLNTKIINADAFQVYKGFDVGTAKPSRRSLYELLDICEPWEPFSVGRFVELAAPLCRALSPCIVSGGTGLYARALFEGYSDMAASDSELRRELKDFYAEHGREALLKAEGVSEDDVPDDARGNPQRLIRFLEKRRLPRPVGKPPALAGKTKFKFGLSLERAKLVEAIERRVHRMVQNGWRREVENLLAAGVRREWPAFRAIGYGEMADYINGKCSLDAAIEQTIIRTRQYSKRQLTWLRKEPGLRWLDANAAPSQLAEQIERITGEEPHNG